MPIIFDSNHKKSTNPNQVEFNKSSDFILIKQSILSFDNQSNAILSDFLPKSKYKIHTIIVTSKKSLNNFVTNSKVFLIAVTSFISQISNTFSYFCYKFTTSSLYKLQTIPATLPKVKDDFIENITTLILADTRDLWWIELKLDTKRRVRELNKNLSILLQVTKKLYLGFFVVFCISLLNFGLVANLNNTPSNSFLSQFLNNNSIKTEAGNQPFTQDSINLLNQGLNQSSPVKAILEYQVKNGDTLTNLSDRFGISVETIKFNNTIETEVIPESKIYLPWRDGYIYNLSSSEKADDIAKKYSVDATELKNLNRAIMNPNSDSFDAKALVLIPTTDFAGIIRINDSIASAKKAELEKQRTQALASQSISYSQIPSSVSPSSNATGSFIWPTSGSISRCYSSGHKACDIANRASPDIVSVQSGTVSAVYRFTVYGYGLAVVVDHGGGVQTLYAHMSDIYVSQGQAVSQGQSLGRMGQTGLATGIHLHFEVRVNGTQIDPLSYLP
jgi:murein DD-endopeptidase MepM/ murein hydrolase activator NlpD